MVLEPAIPAECVAARRVLLDALEVLQPHVGSFVLVGAQAVYEHAPRGLDTPPYTTDADLAIDPDLLATEPDIAPALLSADFSGGDDPGAWRSADGVAVDLMVPESQAAGRSRRAAPLTGHHRSTARRTRGLEVALVDHSLMTLRALDGKDGRAVEIRVAGPAALAVAKTVKLQERIAAGRPQRVDAKDAGDLLRLLRSCDVAAMGARLGGLGAGHPPLAALIGDALLWLAGQVAQNQSELLHLTVDAAMGTESRNQIVESMRTLGRRLVVSYEAAVAAGD